MSGLFGSTTIKGNQITDFADQTSTVGIPIPFGYGTFQTDGNVIWIADVVTHVTKKKQGKGGVKTETYTYTRSYAIGFCQGEIYGYLTLTRDGKIVYTTDPNAKVEDLAFAQKWKQSATFYYGTKTQMPDSTIEAKEGAGQVSAFRDLAYIVVENDDVTDGAGAVPSYQAIVVATPPEVYMSSRPYPILVTDEMSSEAAPFSGHVSPQPFVFDNCTSDIEPRSGTLRQIVKQYDILPPDNITVDADPRGGDIFHSATQYDMPPSDFFSGDVTPLRGDIFKTSVEYDLPVDNISGDATPQSGELG